MDEKVNLLLLWKLLHANAICTNVDCSQCLAETECNNCPKMDRNLLYNAKIVADFLYNNFLYSVDKDVPVEEVLNLMQSTIGEQDDTNN